MREIDLGSSAAPAHVRLLVGGKITSGKTSFGATAPYPLFFGDITEGGFNTIRGMDHNLFWDPKFIPKVWAMEKRGDYFSELDRLQGMIAKKQCPYQTLVFDSLSVYSQRVIRELKRDNPGIDNRQRYGDLGDAVQILVDRVHALPMHVIWLCHTDEDDKLVVSGKASTAAFANMDAKLLVRVEVPSKGLVNYQMHTRPFRGATWIGKRFGNFPDPMIPSFKMIAHHMGLAIRPVSYALPSFNGHDYPNGTADFCAQT